MLKLTQYTAPTLSSSLLASPSSATTTYEVSAQYAAFRRCKLYFLQLIKHFPQQQQDGSSGYEQENVQ